MATRQLRVTPLIDIHGAEFAHQYELGLRQSMYGERQETSPLPDSYLVNNLMHDMANGYFDGQHDHLLSRIGFYIGMLHGHILSPQTEALKPNATTLVVFHSQEAARGYRIGREYYFCEASPHECRSTDIALIERLRELARESLDFRDEERTWYYSIGCLLGELSGQLFPAALTELQEWEAERQKWLKDCC